MDQKITTPSFFIQISFLLAFSEKRYYIKKNKIWGGMG
jgi:hypothetical protein